MELTLKQTSETSVKTKVNDFTIQVDRPVSNGGGGKGLMGGQYMLIGVGGCFCSTLFAAAQSRDITIEGLTAHVEAQFSDDQPKRITRISIGISYNHCSKPEDMNKLLDIAEKGCISVNTIKRGVEIETRELAL